MAHPSRPFRVYSQTVRSEPSPEAPILYHFWPSLCSQKVRLALAEKGVAYTSRLVNIGPPMENYEPWYARIHPGMVVPALQVGEEVITDSARIVVEVDRRFPGPDLRQDDPRVQELIALQDGLSIRELGYGSRSGLLGFLSRGALDQRLRVLTERREANPDLAPLYEARLADVRTWKDVTLSDDALAARRAEVLDALTALEAALEGADVDAPGLVGAWSLADVVWTVVAARLRFMGFTPHMGPRTLLWYARAKARPTFEEAQVWERVRPTVMAPIIGQVLLKRLGMR